MAENDEYNLIKIINSPLLFNHTDEYISNHSFIIQSVKSEDAQS